MQFVTLEDLKKLIKLSQSIKNESKQTEILGLGLTFKDVCDAYENCQKQIDFLNTSKVQQLYIWLKESYLKDKCPPIVLVGVGSSRTAYACLGGKCLKVAMNNAGIAQNKQEWENTAKKHWWTTTYDCFAHTYAANKDFTLLLSECCARIDSQEQLAKAFDISNIIAFNAIVDAICKDKKHNASSASTSLKKKAIELKDKYSSFSFSEAAEVGAKWLERLHQTRYANMTPGQKSFAQLMKFWQKNGVQKLLPGDVLMHKNWGFAIRNGVIAPVMLDIGLSSKVADKFYE